MRHTATAILIAIIAFGDPSVATANAGTPLMWASALHMLFGNAAIGVFEGMLLASVFKVQMPRAVGLMILANYLSAWLGWAWLVGRIEKQIRFDLYNTWALLWLLVAVAYVVTIVLEWPFVAGCFVGKCNWFRRSCTASLMVQTVSYILLFGWYGLASGTSLYTKMSIVALDQVLLPDDVLVYYIADEDGDVYLRELSTGRTEKVFELNSTDRNDTLSFGGTGWQPGNPPELVVLLESGDINNPESIPVGVTVPEAAVPHDDDGRIERRGRFVSPSAGQATKLGAAAGSPWSFDAGYWPIVGLRGENHRTGEQIAFALETPFAQWAVRNAILLPTDRVLFQLGERQICVLEPESRKIARLTFGRGAVAVLRQPPQPVTAVQK